MRTPATKYFISGEFSMTSLPRRRRPGPFGPAEALLSENHIPVTVREDTLAWDALDRMMDTSFSQLPVVDEHGHVMGVFSYRSYAIRTLEFRGQKVDATELTVAECMERAEFIPPDDYIDTNRATDWGQIDYILVGERIDLKGVLTTSDVFGRLTDFAEAFVLLYEIELDLRDVIQMVLSEAELQAVFHELSPPNSRPVQSLEDFQFGQYVGLITNKTRWPQFEQMFRSSRDATLVDLHLTMNARGTIYHDGVLFCEIAQAEASDFQPAGPLASSGRDFDVWEVNPIVKVFPDDPPGEPAQHVRIAAARNEREVFQLVVRPNRRLDQLDVKCTPLVGPSGAALPAVEVERVAFVPIDNRSSYFRSDLPEYYRKLPNNAGRTDGWVGEWPDPVPPFSKMDLPSGRNLPLWLTVHVPADAKPGEYRGSLTLTPANAAATNLPISVTVWDFALPKVSHLKVIYDLRGGPRGGVFGGADPKARLRTWYRFLAERRVSPGLLYPHPKLTFKDGKVSMDFTDFDEMARYCFDELGINVIYTPWYFYAFGWAYKPRKFAGFEAFTPEYEKAFTDAYRLFMAHLKEKGWYDKVVYYISDEPHFRHDFVVEQMKKMCDLAHRADPNVPIYSSTWRHVPQWNGYLDIWGVGQYGCFPVEEMDRRIADGEKLWFTTDGQMATDTPYCGTERLLPYYCLKYGVEGYEFWGVSWWTYDPWKYGWHTFKRQSSDGKEYRWVRYPNGDGYLAYPGDAIGREEPVSTIRLDQAREGVEDYEYFVILRDLIAHAKTARLSTAEADAALESVKALVSIPNPGGYRSTDIMPDPDAIPKVRRAVAEQILRLNKAVRKR